MLSVVYSTYVTWCDRFRSLTVRHGTLSVSMTLFARCNLSQHNSVSHLSQLSHLHTHGCASPPLFFLVCNGRLTRQVCPSDKCIPKARNGSTLTEFLIFAKCPCIKICKTLNIQLILVITIDINLHFTALGSLGKASGSAITGEMSRKQGNSTTRDYEECWTPSFER